MADSTRPFTPRLAAACSNPSSASSSHKRHPFARSGPAAAAAAAFTPKGEPGPAWRWTLVKKLRLEAGRQVLKNISQIVIIFFSRKGARMDTTPVEFVGRRTEKRKKLQALLISGKVVNLKDLKDL